MAIKYVARLSSEGTQSSKSHVARFHCTLKNATDMKEILLMQNSAAVSPASLLDISHGNCQRALLD
jgi:hypothetical protein